MRHLLKDFRFIVTDWFASRGESVRHDTGATKMLRDSTHARGMSNGLGKGTNDRADRVMGGDTGRYADSFADPDSPNE